jgi:hypothetical protein
MTAVVLYSSIPGAGHHGSARRTAEVIPLEAISAPTQPQLGEEGTFGSAAEQWFATKGHRKPMTLAGYRSLLDTPSCCPRGALFR